MTVGLPSPSSTSPPALLPVPQHVLDYIVDFLRTEVWPVVARGNNARVEIDLAPHASEFQVRMLQSRRVQLSRPLAKVITKARSDTKITKREEREGESEAVW